LPHPTTSTRLPFHGAPFAYAELCTIGAPNAYWPGQLGANGVRV
jgi:hypothetical protein